MLLAKEASESADVNNLRNVDYESKQKIDVA